MGYFDIKPGGRPQEPSQAESSKPQLPAEQQGLFANSLGVQPGRSRSLYGQEEKHVQCCPLCQLELRMERGRMHCSGCMADWWRNAQGELQDVASLPYGLCSCCEEAQPLQRHTSGAICPASATVFVLLPEGILPLAQAAPYGLCQCCVPAAPLLLIEGALCCRAKPINSYVWKEGKLSITTHAMAKKDLHKAIDEALRSNTASATLYGLFDIDQ